MKNNDITRRLRVLAYEMREMGSEMAHQGGESELGRHGREMIGAASIAEQWADAIESESEAEQ